MNRKFIFDLITNRFGIVLAALNVSYFFIAIHANNGAMRTTFSALFMCMNFPSAIPALLFTKVVEEFVGPMSHRLSTEIAGNFLAVFMVIQWLLIAHIAKFFARKLKI